MYCHDCGTQLPDSAKFCHKCGGAVSGSSVPGCVPPTPAPEPVICGSAPAFPEPAAGPIPQEIPAGQAAVTPVLDDAPPLPPPFEDADLPVAPKKHRVGLIIGICAGVVALLLSIILMAGGPFFDWSKPGSDEDAATEGTNSQQEDDEEDPGDDVGEDTNSDEDASSEIKLDIKEAELSYELTDEDLDAYYGLLAFTEELAIEGNDEDAVREALEELDDSFIYLRSQLSVAAVLHYCDLEDADASDLYLSCTKTVTQANDEYIKMCRRVYGSDSPAKDVFFEDWTELDMELLMAYTDEVMDLIQRNSEIEVEYQKLQDESDMYEAMVPLYIEMVQNKNRIAQIYGYDNYYEYAYQVEYSRDYDPDQVDLMRTYVIEYIPDAFGHVSQQLTDDMASLNAKEYMAFIDLLFGSYEGENEAYITGYLETLPQQTRDDMLDMFNGNIIIANDSNAMEGAFTTAIGMDRQICFFGPGYSSPMTLIHEVGHYYGGCHQYLDDLPLDLAETQSQGNEWLFLKYLEGELSEDLYYSMVDYKFTNDLAMIMICMIVDEFEQQVYTHPSIDKLTSDDLDAIMEEVCLNYGGIGYLSSNVADIQQYWRMVVVEQPVYYISYAVSAIGPIDLYLVAGDDYAAAVEIYQALIENADPEAGFLSNITAAGLSSPFDKEFYQELGKLVENER